MIIDKPRSHLTCALLHSSLTIKDWILVSHVCDDFVLQQVWQIYPKTGINKTLYMQTQYSLSLGNE